MKNELRKLIREALGSNENRYISKNVKLELFLDNILGKDDFFDDSSTVDIEWGLDIEEKNYGIVNFKPILYKLTLNAKVYREEKEDIEEFNRVIDFGLGVGHLDVFEGFKVNIEKDNGNNSLFPIEVLISDKYKSIDIIFQYP